MATGDSGNFQGSLVEQIIASEAVVHLNESNVILPLVTSVGKENADTISIPVWNQGTNQVTSADVGTHTEGNDASAVALDSNKVTLTMDSYSFYLPVYDEAQDSSIEDINERLGRLGASAVGAKIDSLLANLFDGFSGTAGTSSTAIDIDDLFDAVKTLKSNGAPAGYSGVFHPKQIWGSKGLSKDLLSNEFGGSPAQQSEMLGSGWVGTLAGINLYSSQETVIDSNTAEGAVFSKEALAFGYVNPMIRVEAEREKKKLRNDVVFSMFCDAGELVDAYGVEIKSDVS